MAPDEDAFLRAIQANPTDPVAKLVYADWLDERGEPTKAEWLRAAAEGPDEPRCTDGTACWRRDEHQFSDGTIGPVWADLVDGRVGVWDAPTTLALGRLEGRLSTLAWMCGQGTDEPHIAEVRLVRPLGTLLETAADTFADGFAPVHLEPRSDPLGGLDDLLSAWHSDALARLLGDVQLGCAARDARAAVVAATLELVREVARPRAGWWADVPAPRPGVIRDDIILEGPDRVLFLHFSVIEPR